MVLVIKYLASWVYRVILVLYEFLLQKHMIKQYKFNLPIVSVGNIAMGGSGKTPFILFLSRLLSKQNISHVIISRGYKKKIRGSVIVHDGAQRLVQSPEECGDEPFMLAVKLKKVPVVVDEKKQRAIKTAIKHFNPQIILLDDGFQSRYLGNVFNFVLLNALDEKQDLRIFPLGKLREPVRSLYRANVLVTTKQELAKTDNPYMPLSLPFLQHPPCFNSQLTFNLLQYHKGEGSRELVSIETRNFPSDYRLFGCCGVGDPKSFRLALQPFIKQIVRIQTFPDHYSYANNSVFFLGLLKELEQQEKINALITTYKDFIKIKSLGGEFDSWVSKNNFGFFVLDLNFSLNSKDEKKTLEMIKNLIP